MADSEARRRFAVLADTPQGAFRLAEGALLIAQEEYPSLDIAAYLQRFDSMAAEVSTRLGLEIEPRAIVRMLNTYLFDELGFRGNTEQYYDARNSFLNEVLERRTGIPITLSVAYIEMARIVGLPIVGVGMPGHFLVQYSAQPGAFWIDPFHQGQILSHADCQTLLAQMYGKTVAWSGTYLEPVSDHAILQRMLYNLKAIYVHYNDHPRALSVVERLLLLRPDVINEVRDRGLLRAQLRQFDTALDDLQLYVQLAPDAPDTPAVQRQIDSLRGQLQR